MVRSILFVTFASLLYGRSRAATGFLQVFVRQDSGEPLVSALSRNLTLADLFGFDDIVRKCDD